MADIGTIEGVKQALAKNPYAFDRVATKTDDTIVHCLPHHAVHKATTGK